MAGGQAKKGNRQEERRERERKEDASKKGCIHTFTQKLRVKIGLDMYTYKISTVF